MGLTMVFNYVLLGLALLFISLTKKDGTNDDCHVPAHHHEHMEEEHEMDDLKKQKEIDKVE